MFYVSTQGQVLTCPPTEFISVGYSRSYEVSLLKQPTSSIKVTTMFIFFYLKRKRTKRKQIQGVRDFDSLPLENPQHPKRPKGSLWKPAQRKNVFPIVNYTNIQVFEYLYSRHIKIQSGHKHIIYINLSTRPQHLRQQIYHSAYSGISLVSTNITCYMQIYRHQR